MGVAEVVNEVDELLADEELGRVDVLILHRLDAPDAPNAVLLALRRDRPCNLTHAVALEQHLGPSEVLVRGPSCHDARLVLVAFEQASFEDFEQVLVDRELLRVQVHVTVLKDVEGVLLTLSERDACDLLSHAPVGQTLLDELYPARMLLR